MSEAHAPIYLAQVVLDDGMAFTLCAFFSEQRAAEHVDHLNKLLSQRDQVRRLGVSGYRLSETVIDATPDGGVS